MRSQVPTEDHKGNGAAVRKTSDTCSKCQIILPWSVSAKLWACGIWDVLVHRCSSIILHLKRCKERDVREKESQWRFNSKLSYPNLSSHLHTSAYTGLGFSMVVTRAQNTCFAFFMELCSMCIMHMLAQFTYAICSVFPMVGHLLFPSLPPSLSMNSMVCISINSPYTYFLYCFS